MCHVQNALGDRLPVGVLVLYSCRSAETDDGVDEVLGEGADVEVAAWGRAVQIIVVDDLDGVEDGSQSCFGAAEFIHDSSPSSAPSEVVVGS